MTMPIEVFPNPCSERNYVIRHRTDEFTSVCPKTGQPDFATLLLSYVADKHCLELKAYKLYLQGFRNEGIFYEAVTNRILDELVSACEPRWMRVETRWGARGGIRSRITAEFLAENFSPGLIPSD